MDVKKINGMSIKRSRPAAITGLALICGTMMGAANAQAVVTDPAHTMLTKIGWVKNLIEQGRQYAQQIQQYQTQVQQYQTQIRQLEQQYVKGSVFRDAMMKTAEFTPRALNEGVSGRCPASWQSMLASSAATQTCTLIVQTENLRYNAVVDVLNKSKERNQRLQELYDERASIPQENTGELLANTNGLEALGKTLDMDMQRARTQTEAYDRQLALLKEDLKLTTAATLDGGGLVDGVIRGAALRAALSAARRRDR